MSLTYSTWVDQLSNLAVISSTNASFQTFLPGCIDYAEQRIYRELDLNATRIQDSTGSLTVNNRVFTLPTASGTFLVVETINIFTPAGLTTTLNPTVFVSRNFMDMTYPTITTATGVPQFWSWRDNANILVAPAPDAAYRVQVSGTIRPAPLSATNTTTILTTMLPDLFMAASMVFASGYMRDFGRQADDPQMGATWETEYQKLVGSAGVEEFRKKYQSQAWTSQIPNPVATPPRV